jgi:hypothetical protein
MKVPVAVICLPFVALVLALPGCDWAGGAGSRWRRGGSNQLSVYMPYTAVKSDIMPLTEFVSARGVQKASQLKVYVSLLDAFNCQVKSPGVFRFELYEHVERSSDPKGKRIVLWPDIDLTDPAANSSYWRDFLRAYEFILDFEPRSDRAYVLQVTCLSPNGKRLTDEFGIKYAK